MEDKYVMLVDENGQPYIAHSINLRQTVRNVGNSVRSAGSNAVNAARTTASNVGNRVATTARNAGTGAGRGVRAVHKYIAKIGEGAQARYFYTQEELRAYQQQAARQAQGMANKAGQTMRNVGNKAGQAMKNAGNSVQNAGRKVVDTVKDKAGVDERQRAEEAWSKVPKQLSSKDEKGMQAFKEANKAQDEYRNTPLGRAEYVGERVKEIATGVDGSARDIAERAGNAVKSKYDRIRDEFKDTFRKEPPKAELSPEGTERIIKEDIIPETIIREDKIHEDKIKENVTPEKRVIEKVVSEGKVRNKNQDKTAEKVDSEPKTKDGYEKKPNPRNSSGVINSDTIYADAKEAGLNVDAYRKANDEFYKLSKELMKKYSEPKTGAESLVRRMFYEDPAYIAAREKLKEEEAKVVAKLYK